MHQLTKTKIASLRMPCLTHVSRSSWLQKATDASQKCPHTFRAGCWTFFPKCFLQAWTNIFAWKTTQSLDPFASLFRLQIVIFSEWGKLSAKTHIECIQLLLHRSHWQVEMHPVHYQAKFWIGCLKVKGFATANVNPSPTAVFGLLYKSGIFQETFVHHRWITALDTMPSKNYMLSCS